MRILVGLNLQSDQNKSPKSLNARPRPGIFLFAFAGPCDLIYGVWVKEGEVCLM